MIKLGPQNLTKFFKLIKTYIVYVLGFFILCAIGILFSIIELSKNDKRFIMDVRKIEKHSYSNLTSSLLLMESIFQNPRAYKSAEMTALSSDALYKNYIAILTKVITDMDDPDLKLFERNGNYRIALRHDSYKIGTEKLSLIHNEVIKLLKENLNLLYTATVILDDIVLLDKYNNLTTLLAMPSDINNEKKLDELMNKKKILYHKQSDIILNGIESKTFKAVEIKVKRSTFRAKNLLKVFSVIGFGIIWLLLTYSFIKFKERSRS